MHFDCRCHVLGIILLDTRSPCKVGRDWRRLNLYETALDPAIALPLVYTVPYPYLALPYLQYEATGSLQYST